LIFELNELRDENQRLKAMMIASNFASAGSGGGGGGGQQPKVSPRPAPSNSSLPSPIYSSSSTSSQSASLQSTNAQQPLRTSQSFTPPILHMPSASGSAPSGSGAQSSRAGVYSSGANSGSGSGGQNAQLSSVYRPNTQALQTLTSLLGRKGRVQSGGARKSRPAQQYQQQPQQYQASALHAAYSQPQPQQHQQAQHWESERDRSTQAMEDGYGMVSPAPRSQHVHQQQAWDARGPATQQQPSQQTLQQQEYGMRTSRSSSIPPAASSSQQTHRTTPSLTNAAALNPNISQYMQQHAQIQARMGSAAQQQSLLHQRRY
jgi:hypothetical protein